MGRTERKRKRKKNVKHVTNRDDRDIFQLRKWLKLKNIKLKVSEFEDTGRGLKCTDRIHAGDEIIKVPLRFLINVETRCDINFLLTDIKKSPQLYISTILLYERHLGEASKFVNYIRVIPEYYSTLFFCTEDEIKTFPDVFQIPLMHQSTSIKESYKLLMETILNETCLHCNILLRNIFSYKDFIWAWFTGNTRAVHFKNKSENGMALVPFLDMFNHSNDADVEVKTDCDSYSLKSLKPYKKHDQVFIKYGSHSNYTLLLEYGFILRDNPNDFVEFSFSELGEAVQNYNFNYGKISKLKYDFIKKHNLNKNLTKNAQEFSWNFNGLLYVLTSKDENISLLQAKTYSGKLSDSEKRELEDISCVIAYKKHEYFCDILHKMESINNCSNSFSIAKDLIRIYISFLSN